MKSDLDKFKEIVGWLIGGTKKSTPKRRRGRPKGSKNKSRVRKSYVSSEVKKALRLIKRNKKIAKQ